MVKQEPLNNVGIFLPVVNETFSRTSMYFTGHIDEFKILGSKSCIKIKTVYLKYNSDECKIEIAAQS